MRLLTRAVQATVLCALFTHAAWAQTPTAEEIIDKTVAALGGREAHAKIKSRSGAGTITLSTPAGDIKGTIETQNAVPNKQRAIIKADLAQFGMGELVVDQRFDGSTGYTLDSLQGNREITGNQLDNMRNATFPNPFIGYKELGISVKLEGKAKSGERDAYVLVFEPTSGSTVRQFIDAETFMPLKTVAVINVPQLGQDLEQTTELRDYREIDGVKVPFTINSSSSVQSFTIAFEKVQHNVTIDPALFSKPAQ